MMSIKNRRIKTFTLKNRLQTFLTVTGVIMYNNFWLSPKKISVCWQLKCLSHTHTHTHSAQGYWRGGRCVSQPQTGPDCCRECNSKNTLFHFILTVHTFYCEREHTVNRRFLSYDLAGAWILVCIRRPSDVVPHLAWSHDQDEALEHKTTAAWGRRDEYS